MAECLVEVWDANETEVLYYFNVEIPHRADIRVTSQIGSTLHPVAPESTVHVKIVMPQDSEVKKSGKGEKKKDEEEVTPNPEPTPDSDVKAEAETTPKKK